jgi:hypothetical protein
MGAKNRAKIAPLSRQNREIIVPKLSAKISNSLSLKLTRAISTKSRLKLGCFEFYQMLWGRVNQIVFVVKLVLFSFR